MRFTSRLLAAVSAFLLFSCFSTLPALADTVFCDGSAIGNINFANYGVRYS